MCSKLLIVRSCLNKTYFMHLAAFRFQGTCVILCGLYRMTVKQYILYAFVKVWPQNSTFSDFHSNTYHKVNYLIKTTKTVASELSYPGFCCFLLGLGFGPNSYPYQFPHQQ